MTKPKKTVLILDDELDVASILTELVEGLGHQVITHSTGLHGFLEINHDPYDLIITDHNMPQVTGAELIGKIRESPRNKNTPILMITGFLTVELQNELKSISKVTILEKPFESEQVIKTVEALIK
jgi:CheY-like chemotaxis protein